MSVTHQDGLSPRCGPLGTLRRRVVLPISLDAIPPVLAAADIAWILLLGSSIGLGYHLLALGHVGDIRSYMGMGIAVAALFAVSGQAADLYRPSNLLRPWRQIRRAITLWILVFGCLATVALLLKIGAIFSRITVVLFFVGGICVITVTRAVVARVLAEVLSVGALRGRRIAIIGTADQIKSNALLRQLEPHGYAVGRVFTVEVDAWAGGRDPLQLAEVVDYVRNSGVDEVVLAIPWSSSRVIEQVADELRVLPVPVTLVPDTDVSRYVARPVSELGPIRAIEIQHAPLTLVQQVVKQTLDRFLAAAGLFLVLPMLGLLALTIRLESPGPAFFLQLRIGFNGRPFRIFKLRTMSTLDDGPVVRQASRNDPRVTSLGRMLRALSIDELPQLLNVLRGEMSLVGPRPHALTHDDQYGKLIATYAMRRKMKPGLTGWAQVNGCRGETPNVLAMQRRIDYDLWYIECWSLWLDVRIILMTVAQLLRPRNVY